MRRCWADCSKLGRTAQNAAETLHTRWNQRNASVCQASRQLLWLGLWRPLGQSCACKIWSSILFVHPTHFMFSVGEIVILSAIYLFVFLCFLCALCVFVFLFLSSFFPFLCLTLYGLFSFEILQSWVRLSQITLCALFHNADSMCYSSKTTRLLKEPCAAASSPFTRKRTRFRFVQFFPRIFQLHFEYLIRYQE